MKKVDSVKIAIVASLWIALCLSGCKQGSQRKEYPQSDSPQGTKSQLIPINVQVESIDEYYGGAVTGSGVPKESFRTPVDSTDALSDDIISTFKSIPSASMRTRVTMKANIRFRLLAYKGDVVSTANYAGQCDYMTNDSGIATPQTNPFMLKPGTYKFVLYSLETSAAIPAFDGKSATTVSVANEVDFSTCILDNKVVAADASGSFTLTGVIFNRQCAQLEIVVSLIDLANITSCEAKVSGMNNAPATWTVGKPDISVTGSAGSATLSFPSLNKPTITSSVIKILPMASQSITVTIPTLRANNSINYGKKMSFSIPARTFVKGGNYRITITFDTSYVFACGYTWKKTNLRDSSGNL